MFNPASVEDFAYICHSDFTSESRDPGFSLAFSDNSSLITDHALILLTYSLIHLFTVPLLLTAFINHRL